MTDERHHIRVLLIEDDADDVFLFKDMIADQKSVTISVDHVASLTAGIERIRDGGIDIVISDLGLPESRGLNTLTLLLPEVGGLPVIALTDLADQKTGAAAVHAGAQDYLFKGEVTGSLLLRAILYAIERKKMEVERKQLVQELQAALAQVKQLSGLLPICASCKKIRDDKGAWHQIETYIHSHSEAQFSHGICEECARRLYPEYYKEGE